ncbi:oligopeptidase B [Candidatus Wolfebacteria bacterium]|nr:MAG: oligopeptidase B [Candidatus Wolfebacteria bacterium]
MNNKPQPPKAKKIPHETVYHGDTRIDEYFWLREKTNPEVITYLKDENTYTKEIMKDTEDAQAQLYKEMKGRIKETDMSVPVKIDNYYYYTRTEEGKQYPIYARKKESLDSAEEILLDQNILAEGYEYFQLGVFDVSPDHSLLAYSVDTNGSEEYTIFIKNLDTGELLSDQITHTYHSFEWINDSQTFFYSVLDETKRPHKVYRHTLGTDTKEDTMMFHEPDGKFFVNLYKTRTEKYIMILSGSKVTSEVRAMDADEPTSQFEIIQPREKGIEYYVHHHGDTFYIRTNKNALNFKVMKTSVETPTKENWKEVIAHDDNISITDIDLFKEYLVISQREKGLEKINIINVLDDTHHFIPFPEEVYTVGVSSNPDFNTNTLRYSYSSLTTPSSVFEYDMEARTQELKKQKEVLGGFNKDDYIAKRIVARAPDNEEIPMSVVYKKDLYKKNEANPLLLTGYGSYGISSNPYFSSNIISLLDRGFVYVIAHIRGGSELGEHWYEQGKYLNKKNTFTDFIACAEHLIKEDYTAPESLAIWGGSAGGLLMGAVSNMRPDLFNAVVADVPFVDVINTMMDPTLPLTIAEYEEWGDPNEKKNYEYILSYSPYDNIEAKDYPHMLVLGGLNDPRVQYWEPAKWVAKLRDMKTDNNTLLLKTNMGAGHGGSSGRYEYLKEAAFIYAFIVDMLQK